MEKKVGYYELEALEYIAKLSDGGMRDAITYMDKCLAYSTDLTLENVIAALGTTDYDTMIKLTDSVVNRDAKAVVSIIEDIHNSGKELKQFIKLYMQFLLDVNKYLLDCGWEYLNIPKLPQYEKWLSSIKEPDDIEYMRSLLSLIINLNSEIKYNVAPKYDIEAVLIGEC